MIGGHLRRSCQEKLGSRSHLTIYKRISRVLLCPTCKQQLNQFESEHTSPRFDNALRGERIFITQQAHRESFPYHRQNFTHVPGSSFIMWNICGCYTYNPESRKRTYLPQVKLDIHTRILSTASRTVLSQSFANLSRNPLEEIRYAGICLSLLLDLSYSNLPRIDMHSPYSTASVSSSSVAE